MFTARAGLELLLMHLKKPLCVTRVSLTHPVTHCTPARARGDLSLLGPPHWQVTCLCTPSNFLPKSPLILFFSLAHSSTIPSSACLVLRVN